MAELKFFDRFKIVTNDSSLVDALNNFFDPRFADLFKYADMATLYEHISGLTPAHGVQMKGADSQLRTYHSLLMEMQENEHVRLNSTLQSTLTPLIISMPMPEDAVTFDPVNNVPVSISDVKDRKFFDGRTLPPVYALGGGTYSLG